MRPIATTCIAALTLLALASQGATLYVDINSINGTPPYATWETAATNIQDAVNITSDGDTVLVTNGVYDKGTANFQYFETNVVLVTNRITVRSVNGADATIIDGRGAVRCVAMWGTNATLDGFTLVNGSSANVGAGAAVEYGTVDHCVIISNKAYTVNSSGGGVFLMRNARLVNSTVAWNVCTNGSGSGTGSGSGGGVYCDGGDVTNCSIVFNSAYTCGGGVVGRLKAPGIPSLIDSCYVVGNRILATNLSFVHGGGGMYCNGAMVGNCTIVSNVSGGHGGGLLLDNNNSVTNCVVEKNQAARSGGGLCGGNGGVVTVANTLINDNGAAFGGGAAETESTALSLVSCVISSNKAGGGGGLSYVRFSHSCSIFANSATGDIGGGIGSYFGSCVISNNTAGRNGGGVAFGFAMTNCIVIGNTAGGQGGGIWLPGSDCVNTLVVGNTSAVGGGVWGSVLTLLKNCTISGNHSETGGGVYGGSGIQVRNSVVYGNTALDGANYVGSGTNITYSCVAPLMSGTGNVDSDPIFAGVSAGDYRLAWGSPCIDSGTADTDTDLDGFARPLDGDNDTVADHDMGAYEFGFDHSLADADGDAMSDSDEIGAGTSPLDPASVFAIQNSTGDAAGWVVTWSSVTNKLYDLYHSTNLLVGFVQIATNVPATAPQNVFTDLTATADANYYQVRVRH